MEYRVNRKNGDKVSVIGLGTGMISDEGYDEGLRILETAWQNGVNYFDLAGGRADLFRLFGETFGGQRRRSVYYQLHFGAVYDGGKYGWSIKADVIARNVEKELKALGTDYIDYGFIHCLDELTVWEMYKKKGVFRLIEDLHRQGVIRNIGLSSHTPTVAERIMDEVDICTLMFSINPAYDYHHGTFANGSADERWNLYRRCQKEGIGITAMKPYAGGQLLNDKQSIFGKALTEVQCIKYALDKPGVLTVVPGVSNTGQLEKALRLLKATEQEKDYSDISVSVAGDMEGRCVYCNHCAPCPAGIDIGLVNKYYDLALIGDEMAVYHYRNLDRHASDCTGCGHCDSRCPFRVKQKARMSEIEAFMVSYGV